MSAQQVVTPAPVATLVGPVATTGCGGTCKDCQGAVFLRVMAETRQFGEVGREWLVGPVGDHRHGRWCRPVSSHRPRPCLGSSEFPPTFMDANDVERAFGLPLSAAPDLVVSPRVRRPDPLVAELLDIFAEMDRVKARAVSPQLDLFGGAV